MKLTKLLFIVAVLAVTVGCPGGLPNPADQTISFNVRSNIGRDVEENVDLTIAIVSVTIRNNQSTQAETFALSGDPIVFQETRGFCCYVPGIYTVTVRDSLGRDNAAPNILTGEGIKRVEVSVTTNGRGGLSTSVDIRDAPF